MPQDWAFTKGISRLQWKIGMIPPGIAIFRKRLFIDGIWIWWQLQMMAQLHLFVQSGLMMSHAAHIMNLWLLCLPINVGG
jgi:hypothetical protein